MSTDLSRTPLDNAIPAEQVATWSSSSIPPCLQAERTLPTGILGCVSMLRTTVTAWFINREENEMHSY